MINNEYILMTSTWFRQRFNSNAMIIIKLYLITQKLELGSNF